MPAETNGVDDQCDSKSKSRFRVGPRPEWGSARAAHCVISTLLVVVHLLSPRQANLPRRPLVVVVVVVFWPTLERTGREGDDDDQDEQIWPALESLSAYIISIKINDFRQLLVFASTSHYLWLANFRHLVALAPLRPISR